MHGALIQKLLSCGHVQGPGVRMAVSPAIVLLCMNVVSLVDAHSGMHRLSRLGVLLSCYEKGLNPWLTGVYLLLLRGHGGWVPTYSFTHRTWGY